MFWWHAPTRRGPPGGLRPLPPHRRSAGAASRSGRRWRCTGRPSSTSRTSRRSWPTRSRATTSASTRSCAPTSGTCCTTPSAARCSPSTARWPATTPTSGPTPSPRFALGDYEWMLAFEADELHRIVDLMRHLRGAEARRHIREEVPFYTGVAQAGRRAGRRPAVTGPAPRLRPDAAPPVPGRPARLATGLRPVRPAHPVATGSKPPVGGGIVVSRGTGGARGGHHLK